MRVRHTDNKTYSRPYIHPHINQDSDRDTPINKDMLLTANSQLHLYSPQPYSDLALEQIRVLCIRHVKSFRTRRCFIYCQWYGIRWKQRACCPKSVRNINALVDLENQLSLVAENVHFVYQTNSEIASVRSLVIPGGLRWKGGII